MVLIAYRHGLRVGELCALTWDRVDFGQGLLHVARLKHGVPSVHPLGGEELRSLRRLQRDQSEGRHLFQTERGAPMTPAGFRKTLGRIGEASPLAFPVLTRTCCATPAASSSPTTGRTRARCSTIWGTRTFSTRCDTPSSRQTGSRASGRTERTCGGDPRARIAAEMRDGELG